MSRRISASRPVVAAVAALAVSILTACASSPAERAGLRPAVSATDENVRAAFLETLQPPTSLYGLFLAGEAALEKGSSQDAAFFLGRASELAPEADFLKERAFTAALISGDVERAAALAPGPEEGSGATRRLGALARAVNLMAEGEGAQASALLASASAQGSTGTAVILLRPWAAAMAGDWEAATAPVTAENQVARLFGVLSRARLLERTRRYSEAETAYRALASVSDNGLFVLALGEFLERRGRRSEAAELYEQGLAGYPGANFEFALARTRSRSQPRLGSLAEGAAETLLAPAALQMTRREPEVALALLHLALRLNPQQDEAWLLVGDAMESAGDLTAARAAYLKVRPRSREFELAQSRLVWALQREGDAEGALRLAKANNERSRNNAQALSTYADVLRENGLFEESIAVIDRLIQRRSDGAEAWRLYFTRAVALERLGRWDGAEADLQRALSLQPEEPDILNYLGFGWADRGVRLTEALAMLEKAVELRPRSGEIRDSLGWVRYRLGQYEEAVEDLERAVSMAPASAEINDHLGDAYWMVGRRLEAEFQWRRVLTLEADEALRSAVEAKLRTRTQAGTLASVGAQR